MFCENKFYQFSKSLSTPMDSFDKYKNMNLSFNVTWNYTNENI